MTEQDTQVPEPVVEFSMRAAEAVERSVGVPLDFKSETLPVLDHYLRSTAATEGQASALIASMAGAYFGEVVRTAIGGTWSVPGDEPATWRLVLPSGLSFAPARMALGSLLRDDQGEGHPDFQVPPKMHEHLDAALARMAPVSEEEYYSLSCRFDTLEHLQAVLLEVAARLAAPRGIDAPN